MPYLGQNLDQLGVIRVKPNWDAKPAKKDNLPQPEIQSTCIFLVIPSLKSSPDEYITFVNEQHFKFHNTRRSYDLRESSYRRVL